MTADLSKIDPNGPLAYLNTKAPIKAPDNKLGKDAFLKLLVAQMKYQNPMEPASSTDFIAQTAQFTLVEQMEKMSTANEDMLAGQRSATAASMIGKQVQWDPSLLDQPDSPGQGIVQGVRVTADGPLLIVDGWEVPLTRVKAFGDMPADAPGSTVTPPPTDGGTTPPVNGTPPPVDETDPPVDGTEPIPDPEPDPAPAA